VRKLLTALVCAGMLIQPAQAQNMATLLVPSPVGIALTVGQLLMTPDKRKVYFVEVQSQAVTFEAARAEAFRLAVEHAVGSLILSETEVRNSRVVRDEIITYASGYVDRFEIVNRINRPDSVTLTMKIWVAHSALSNRLLNESRGAGQVEGERVNAQIQTFQQQRQAGDRVLTTVLADYPKRAFNVALQPTQVVVDRNRVPHLRLVFDVSWNQLYLNSLGEAVATIAQRTGCSAWRNNCLNLQTVQVIMPGYASNKQAWFDDDMAWRLMDQQMLQTRPAFQVVIKNPQGRVQTQMCLYAPELDHSEYRPWHFVEVGPNNVTVNGARNKRFDAYINIANMPVQQFERVEIAVIRSSQCINQN
jgi:hypothetical protein